MLSPLSHLRLLATPWTVAHEALLSIGFSRQEYWRGLPCPPPGDLPDSGIEPASLGRRILYHCAICTYTNSSSWQWTHEEKYCSSPSILLLELLLRVWASLVGQLVKNPPAMRETWVQSLGWEDPPPIRVFWPGEFHQLYSPWGRKESGRTGWLSLHFTTSLPRIQCWII